MVESDNHQNEQRHPEEAENALNFLNSAENETEPTPKDILGFVPLSSGERGRALHLYEAYKNDESHGVAKYVRKIARSRKDKGPRALASMFRNEAIGPYREAVQHQDVLEAAMHNAPELGTTLFEDEGYDDSARDAVSLYLQAKQELNGVPKDERVSLSELMGVATKDEVVQLVEEVYSNAVLRENFWHRIIDSARDPYPFLDRIAEEEGILRIDPSKDVQKTDYRRGTIQDPEVRRKRRDSDKPY